MTEEIQDLCDSILAKEIQRDILAREIVDARNKVTLYGAEDTHLLKEIVEYLGGKDEVH